MSNDLIRKLRTEVNWSDFAEQKGRLVDLTIRGDLMFKQAKPPHIIPITKEDVDALDAITCFIDSIQDTLVDQYGVPERTIFPNLGEDEEMDLFYDPPDELMEILNTWNEEGDPYQECSKLEAKLKPLGYTFDWGLSGEPYGLRKIK